MTMRKLTFALLLILAMASSAIAGQVQIGYSGSSYGPYQTGQGGEFTIKSLSSFLDLSGYVVGTTKTITAHADTFQAFCLEGNEFISGYSTTYFAKVDTFAEAGGQSGWDDVAHTKDTLSKGTGLLYSQFARGTLAGYNYGAGRSGTTSSSAYLLQQAIWWLEGEEGVAYSAGNIFMAAVTTAFGSQAGAKADGADAYGVYALNIWTVDARGAITKAQSQTYYHDVPDGGATLMLLGGALMGLGALRRKYRR